jgi:glycosyltransferase involved in cell wall biosynthesis
MAISPTISIIIPLYNKQGTVVRTIASILAQTWTDYEALVIDDGSTDGSVDLVKTIRDSRIQVHSQLNAGPGSARNAGTSLSRANYVTFLDADDEWHPQFLERAMLALNKNPESDVFACAFMTGVNCCRHHANKSFCSGKWRWSPKTRHSEITACLSDFIHSSSTVYRTEAVRKWGGFFDLERCTLGEDLFLWITLMMNHGFILETIPLAVYHTEDSELGMISQRKQLPLEPVFTHAHLLRERCPREIRETFELWLANHAMRHAFRHLDFAARDNARWLIRNFPLMRRWPIQYAKLRTRMRCPRAWRICRGWLHSLLRCRKQSNQTEMSPHSSDCE